MQFVENSAGCGMPYRLLSQRQRGPDLARGSGAESPARNGLHQRLGTQSPGGLCLGTG